MPFDYTSPDPSPPQECVQNSDEYTVGSLSSMRSLVHFCFMSWKIKKQKMSIEYDYIFFKNVWMHLESLTKIYWQEMKSKLEDFVYKVKIIVTYHTIPLLTTFTDSYLLRQKELPLSVGVHSAVLMTWHNET